ncbi:MAG: ABC transporter permease [Acidobacteria bacterium]|nr:ABC transporter permease [Acidobacteriota bacterium]MCW5971017.1 ABC transporter permease [Blastocatellales bacterium]
MLAKSPGFTFIAVLSLALGIGATTAIFSLVDRLLVRSLPVDRPDQLVVVEAETVNPRFRNTILPYADFADYRDQNTVFSGMIAFIQQRVKFGESADAKKIAVELVSGDYFDVLGLRAARGRMIGVDDCRTPGAHPVAVLSHGLWQRSFGADNAIVGKTITLNGASYTVIGVAPRGFHGLQLESSTELWAPLMMVSQLAPELAGPGFSPNDRLKLWLRVVGRMKEGVGIAQAQAGLDATARSIWEVHTPAERRNAPFSEKRIVLSAAGRGISFLRSQLDNPLRMLLAATFIVLLVACANVSALLLGRAAERRGEIAVRLALGATRRHLAAQLLTESLMLAGAGGAMGWLLSHWFYDLLLGFQPERIAMQEVFRSGVDPRTLLFALAATIVSGLLLGLIPALQSSRADLVPALKQGDALSAGRERRWSARRILVVAQVAAATVVLIGAGLFVRSLQNLFSIDPGFRAENVLLVPIELPGENYKGEQVAEFFRQLMDRVEAHPDVLSASTAMMTPMMGGTTRRSIIIEGYQPPPGENIAVEYNIVDENYHRLLGIPVLHGRGFTTADDARSPGVVMINEAMARTYFPNQDPIGKRISYGRGMPWLEIVGVTRNVRLRQVSEAPMPYFEMPVAQRALSGYATLLVKTRSEPLGVLGAVRREAKTIEPQAEMEAASTLERDLLRSLAAARMATTLTSAFGIVTLLLAVVGLYGVTSYAVSRRRREIGIRMALGAERRNIIRLVLGEGIWLVVFGEALGIVAAYGAMRWIASQLHGVEAEDPVTFAAVALLLAGVAIAAALVPARRAVRIDPISALREQ